MSAYWCELAWLGDPEPAPEVRITCAAGRIASVERGARAGEHDTVLRGLTLPGLADAHSHAFQRALRGRTQRGLGGSFWTWRERMYALAGELDAARTERLARAAFGEMALAGVTVVGEFDYLHHGEAIAAAAGAAGIRLTLLDACYLRGGLPAFRERSAEAWRARVEAIELPPGRARLGAAIHSVRAVDPAGAALVAAFAAERGLPLHAHVSEQPAENQECRRRHGLSPTALLERAGALGPGFTAVHATHCDADDVARLGAAGATACLCPSTERDLADGIGPTRALLDAGCALALGGDSHALVEPFEEARAIELDARLATGVRGVHDPLELARALSGGGYASLGWPEGGRIAPGALADLTTVSLGSVRLAGTRAREALDCVLFAAGAGDVSEVIVDGEPVVRAGRHVRLDVAAELAAALAP